MHADRTTEQLSFLDHDRMRYSDTVPSRQAGEFIIRDEDGAGAEFLITLYDLQGSDGLSPRLECFGDGLPNLRAFMDLGGLDLIETNVATRDDFSKRLLALGLIDASDKPMPEAS